MANDLDAKQRAAYTEGEATPVYSFNAIHRSASTIECVPRSFPANRQGKEVRKMGVKSFKIGKVRVTALGKDRWRVRYRGGSGQDVQRRLSGLSQKGSPGRGVAYLA